MVLISTYDVRLWLSIPEGDKKPNAKIEAIINSVEDFVESYTNRKLLANTYYQQFDYSYIDGYGRPEIYLPCYPVSYVSDIRIDNDHVFGSGTVLGSQDYYWYSSGKVVSKGSYFTRGRKNIRIDYIAGYAPIVNGTHNSAVSTYPAPYDLTQVMKEMCIESFKEGLTAIHTIQPTETTSGKVIQMFTNNSFWRNTLNKYKAFDMSMQGYDE